MYVDLVVVVVAPWGPGEGGRSQHCKSRGPQSLPWKGSWCQAHLPPPGSIIDFHPGARTSISRSPWRVPWDRKTGRGCLRTPSPENLLSARCSPQLENYFVDKIPSVCYKSIPRISLALAHRILTSLSLITSHFLNCSICWSRSLVSPILARNTPYLK